jgi:hypothetical protein
MTNRTIGSFLQLLCVAGTFSAAAHAALLANCDVNITHCSIPENVLLMFPFGAFGIAGDTVVLEADHTTVSDVFRIFNDLVDTGSGTGLGTTMFLFSADDSTPLPARETYSANVQFIQEGANGITVFTSNGTTYLLNAPEPATFGTLVGGLAVTVGLARRRRSRKPSFSGKIA